MKDVRLGEAGESPIVLFANHLDFRRPEAMVSAVDRIALTRHGHDNRGSVSGRPGDPQLNHSTRELLIPMQCPLVRCLGEII